MSLPLSEGSDGELAVLALAGRQDAYRELLARHRDAVFRLVRASVGDPHEALDVTQETFIAAFCQGNARAIREDIEFRVYQQLMTPQGQKAAYANTPNDHIEKDLPLNKRFMNPPLSDSDY